VDLQTRPTLNARLECVTKGWSDDRCFVATRHAGVAWRTHHVLVEPHGAAIGLAGPRPPIISKRPNPTQGVLGEVVAATDRDRARRKAPRGPSVATPGTEQVSQQVRGYFPIHSSVAFENRRSQHSAVRVRTSSAKTPCWQERGTGRASGVLSLPLRLGTEPQEGWRLGSEAPVSTTTREASRSPCLIAANRAIKSSTSRACASPNSSSATLGGYRQEPVGTPLALWRGF
jgi:hypothetical protein